MSLNYRFLQVNKSCACVSIHAYSKQCASGGFSSWTLIPISLVASHDDVITATWLSVSTTDSARPHVHCTETHYQHATKAHLRTVAFKPPSPQPRDFCSGNGTNLKVGGTGPKQKWGHRSSTGKSFWSYPSTFWL